MASDAPATGQGAIPRFEQTFPTLTAAEVERLRRFGQPRRFADAESLLVTGEPSPGMWLITAGRVSLVQRDGMGRLTPLVEEGAGQFIAEVGSLSGKPALIDARAMGEVEAVLIPPERLRALLIAEAELGERITRALILRRVALIQSGVGGAVLIGPAYSAGVARIGNFLTRNGHPHHVLDPAADPEAGELVARYAPEPQDLPLVAIPDGTVLKNPGEVELGRALGMLSLAETETPYDVAIVGAGPAGLATAVYAASEGLSVAVLDRRAYGGQAGASARIENYLGFPTGISGAALAGRAFVQAQKFGVEMLIPEAVDTLDCSRADGTLRLLTGSGRKVRANAVVVASGAAYRRLAVDRLEEFEGKGVWYWASPIEAKLCAGEEVVLVGGGNSAGQAAVFLSGHARKVRMMVRAEGLAASMSKYLIDRIAASPNIELMTCTEVAALEGSDAGLEKVVWRDRRTGEETTGEIRNLFLFVGADPATGWLADCGVMLDLAGFVLTGPQDPVETHAADPLETSVRGVFAVGDVRSGSVKRVGAAIGEGAQVVAALHRRMAASVN